MEEEQSLVACLINCKERRGCGWGVVVVVVPPFVGSKL